MKDSDNLNNILEKLRRFEYFHAIQTMIEEQEKNY